MKVKPYRVCDVCETEIDKNTRGRLVIKERWCWSAVDREEAGYRRIDLCPKCNEKLFATLRIMIEEGK